MLLKLDNKRSKRWMHSATQNNLVYWNADVCFAHPPPPTAEGVGSIVTSMSVRLSARISRKPHGLPVAATRSPSENVAMWYVFPVLWMKYRFHTMNSIVRHVYSYAARAYQQIHCTYSNQIEIGKCMSWVEHRGEVCYLQWLCLTRDCNTVLGI